MHILNVPSFFLAKRMGWLDWLVLGVVYPFNSKWSIYLLHLSSFYCNILYFLWHLTSTSGFYRSIWCFMSRSSEVPGSSNRSFYLAHNLIQWSGSTNFDSGVPLGMYWVSSLVFSLFFLWNLETQNWVTLDIIYKVRQWLFMITIMKMGWHMCCKSQFSLHFCTIHCKRLL